MHFSTLPRALSYPPSFIDKEFRKFYANTIPFSSIAPMVNNEQQFQQLRRKMIQQLTRSVTAEISCLVVTDCEQGLTTVSSQSVEKDSSDQKKILIHYTHEKRFGSFKRDMHQILTDTFANQIDKQIRLIVGSRNRRDATRQLIRKRPKQSLLKNKPKQREILPRAHSPHFPKHHTSI
jgi:hypothetical protein